ncbi:MAG: glycosyltransferase family 2 protein [Chloroflexota bacterium]|nr:glycosyltransferase family 2 protein [Chloroflexota bacterium]
MMSSVSVVIPVFRSEKSIASVVRQLAEALPQMTNCYEVILVEDNGDDGSWLVIESLAAEFEWVRGFRLMRNYGQHSALLCGIRAANFETIVTMDDDLQHPVDKVPSLVELLNEGYDVAYGTPQRQRHSLLRNLASMLSKWVLQGAMGAETARSISAFRAFRTSLRDSFANYSGPLVNIDVLLTWGTTRFKAIPTPHAPRTLGKSNYSFGKLITHTFNLLTGFSTLPLRLASVIGLLLTLFGLIILIYILLSQVLAFGFEVPGFTFIASLISIFAGAQMFTLGIIGEYLARMHLRIMDKPAYIVRQSTEEEEPVQQ